MQEVMTRIELSGILGKTYGKVHHRLVRTTAETINALAKTINGFEKFLNTSKARGLTYAVYRDKKNIGVDDLGFPVSGEVIRIVPVSAQRLFRMVRSPMPKSATSSSPTIMLQGRRDGELIKGARWK